MVEADTLEQIHAAATEFRLGSKAKFIEVVDVVVRVKAPPRRHGSGWPRRPPPRSPRSRESTSRYRMWAAAAGRPIGSLDPSWLKF